jgi:hypothetical protein
MDFYEDQALPEVSSRPDAVFSGLKLKRTGKGWTPTNYDGTNARLGARLTRGLHPSGMLPCYPNRA